MLLSIFNLRPYNAGQALDEKIPLHRAHQAMSKEGARLFKHMGFEAGPDTALPFQLNYATCHSPGSCGSQSLKFCPLGTSETVEYTG